jgi:hypothetical protein
MADITKKFDDFKNKEIKKFDKTKTYEPLSDDIIALNKLDTGEYEEITEPIEIVQITGMITDEEEIKQLEESFVLDTSVTIKDIKRGDTIWMTALLQRTSGSSINSQKLGVVKVRVVDYYWGLNKLNQIKPIK